MSEQEQFRLPAHLTIREFVQARRPLQLADLLPQLVDFREGFLQLLHAAAPLNGLLELARLLGKRGLDMAQKNLWRLELLFKNALDRSQDGGVVLQGILDAAAFVIVQVGAGQVSEGKHAKFRD